MCLICGHVGCGRYREGHAAQHGKESGHAYALELEAQRVWDYGSDNYVHRLVQSKANGKLVELPSPSPSSSQRDANAR
jgi:BRCA1-associated protein